MNFLANPIANWEKARAPHSSTLAWKIPWTEEPGRLQSMGLLRVGHDWATSLSLFTCMHWRRKWQPTPVFLPRESQGLWGLVGCRLWGRTESDTKRLSSSNSKLVASNLLWNYQYLMIFFFLPKWQFHMIQPHRLWIQTHPGQEWKPKRLYFLLLLLTYFQNIWNI